MKNKLIPILAVILCLLICLSGCGLGNYIDKNGNSQNPSRPVDPDDPSNPDNPSNPTDDYTANVFLSNSLFNPGDANVTVVWRNDASIVRVPLGADGKANAGELDGTFNVYLEGLPTEYSYNPNAYVASADSRRVDILINTIVEPIRGDGLGMYDSQGCYIVRYDGTYRTSIKNSSTHLYYQYTPTVSGLYSIESWINVYSDEINPEIQIYGGTHANKWYIRTLDGGGAELDGGFTKNFRYEYPVSKAEVGNSFTFAVGGISKTGDYPITVDFAITYEGEYQSDLYDIRVIRAEEAIEKAAQPGDNETFNYADLGTRIYSMKNFKYNNGTGFYHYYSEEEFGDDPYEYGKNYGPILCCNLKGVLPSYSTTTIYNANNVGEEGISFNFLRLYNIWIEAEQKFAVYDYTEFIRTDYNRVCNSDGMCYVTEELRQFLQKFAENHSLWTDGIAPDSGTPEGKGYTANQDAMWLFACGFYR